MKFVNHHQGCCGYVPTHADGSEWAHVLTLAAGTVVHADTARECLDELLPGYERCPDDAARLAARTRHAEEVALVTQRARIDLARRSGALPATPGEDDEDTRGLLDLLLAPKTASMLLADPDAPDVQAPWEGPVAIVALTTSYAPHADVPPLRGRIVWLAPETEEGYLRSLAAAGVHDYWAAPPAP